MCEELVHTSGNENCIVLFTRQKSSSYHNTSLFCDQSLSKFSCQLTWIGHLNGNTDFDRNDNVTIQIKTATKIMYHLFTCTILCRIHNADDNNARI